MQTAPIRHPVANIAGHWLAADDHTCWLHRNPSRWSQVLGEVPAARQAELKLASALAARAQKFWRAVPMQNRLDCLAMWAQRLHEQEMALAERMALEIGKPVTDSLAEVRRALTTLQAVIRIHGQGGPAALQPGVRRRPLGVAGLITPWNNPVAIPVGKIAPALALGNGLVWKPAMQAPRTAMLLMETLLESGIPPELASLVFGDRDTARQLIAREEIAAVALTGSIRAGRDAAVRCGRLLKPLQAELGGNNAALVMPDCDIGKTAQALAGAAYSYAGQRCTATRRIIVHDSILDRFQDALVDAIEQLEVGDPLDPATRVGPLISRGKQRSLGRGIGAARRLGATLLTGGGAPSGLRHGCWYLPTLLLSRDPASRLVQEESFGPLAVIQPATDLDEALRLCNKVSQGLVASIHSSDPAVVKRFLEEAEAGNLKLNRPTVDVDPALPFCAWKSSGLGPAEHGHADIEFYTRPQTVYGQE